MNYSKRNFPKLNKQNCNVLHMGKNNLTHKYGWKVAAWLPDSPAEGTRDHSRGQCEYQPWGSLPGKLESQYWATLRKMQQVKGAPALKRPCLKSCAQSGALQVMKDNEGLSKVQQKAVRMTIMWPLRSIWESWACSIWQRGRANNSPQLLERQLQ